MHAADWPAVYVLKTQPVPAVIQVNVRTKTCCLCSENAACSGCDSGQCPDKDWCENRKCSIAKEIRHCYECDEECRKGLLGKIKPYAFTLFMKRYGEEYLLDCLERNEANGIVYHRDGINGDYDDFEDVETLIEYIKTGNR